jgi:hypothetical protein
MSLSSFLPRLLSVPIVFACAIVSPSTAHAGQRSSSPNPPAGEATIDGQLLSCLQGKAAPWPGAEVRIYTMAQSKEIRDILKKLSALPQDNEPTTLQQGFELTNRLGDLALKTPALRRRVKTDRAGKFWFRHVRAGFTYFLLVTDEGEDGFSYDNKEITDLKPGVQRITIVFGGDSEGCKSQSAN